MKSAFLVSPKLKFRPILKSLFCYIIRANPLELTAKRNLPAVSLHVRPVVFRPAVK